MVTLRIYAGPGVTDVEDAQEFGEVAFHHTQSMGCTCAEVEVYVDALENDVGLDAYTARVEHQDGCWLKMREKASTN